MSLSAALHRLKRRLRVPKRVRNRLDADDESRLLTNQALPLPVRTRVLFFERRIRGTAIALLATPPAEKRASKALVSSRSVLAQC